jgi:ATP-dependent Lhr-like helicase
MVLKQFKPELQEIIKKNFKEFTTIQKQAMPELLKGKNPLIIAPTGSGKTEAAFLPVLNGLVNNEDKGIVALYIAPLRSLNRDMLRRMEEWCEGIGCRVEVRHGDTTQSQRSRQRRKPPKMLITTPETLQAILPAKVMRKHLASVKYVIIDEIHELVSDKRGIQLSVAIERLRKLAGKFQTIGLSATVGTPELVAKYYNLNDIIVDKAFKSLDLKVEKPKSILSRISELTGKKSTLIFTNTRVATEMLTNQPRGVKDVGIHHSSLSKEERIETERQLKEGEIKTLVCTSSMELGIDVGEIEQVIQLNSPRQVARLLQRVGRSGHSHKKVSKGTVLSMDFDDIIEAAVIAKDALESRLEETDYFENALDVLAHQIVGMVMEYGDIKQNEVYRTIKKSFPYRNLHPNQFDSVIDVLKRLRLIGWRGDEISRRRNSLFYYYGNLSTIPTYNRYTVIDMASHKPVGVLDEEYVIDCHVNSLFILKGEVWRVVDFRGKRVMVVPVSDIGSETPVWVGEDIPVPYEVAQEVGKIRRIISESLDKKKTNREIGKELGLPLNQGGINNLISTIKKQKEQAEVPTDKRITIEKYIENYQQVVLNTCFGTKVNDTLSRMLGSLLSSKYGEGIGVKVDPYRIVLTGMVLEEKDVLEALMSIKPNSIREILEKTITKTNLFRFSFAHVGKRFGVFKSDVNFREINMKRVIDAYKGTAVYKETLNELFKKYFDLENTEKALKRIRENDIEMDIQAFTTLSQFGLEQFKDAIQAETPERAIIETVKNRLSGRKVDLVCLNCGEIMRHRTIENIEYPIKCPVCQSWMISYMGKKHEELSKIVRKKKRGEMLAKEGHRFLQRAHQSAGLLHSYEKRALLAMNARGVGPRTAGRILEMNLSEDEFYKEILGAERQFVRTSRFWKK